MNYLIEAANNYGLAQIAEQAVNLPQVHGIVIDIDPLWLRLYKLYLYNPNDTEALDRAYYIYRELSLYEGWFFHDATLREAYFPTAVSIDLNWFPSFWLERKNHSNLVVKLLLRPGSAVPDIRYEGQLSIVRQHQPIPRLSAHGIPQFRPLEGGLSLGCSTNAPGTLGGILVDYYGNQYALTCAHVIPGLQADQPAQSDHTSAADIGRVVFRFDPQAHIPGTTCNAYIGGANEMDIALVRLNSSISGNYSIRHIGKVDGFMPNAELHPNLQVEFHGRTSGHKTSIVLGGTGLYNEVEDALGVKHCFKNLMEIKDPSMSSLLLNRPVKGGDSGAWIIGQGHSGNEWCGMIIGENRQTGYALTAQSILDFLSNNKYDLRCN